MSEVVLQVPMALSEVEALVTTVVATVVADVVVSVDVVVAGVVVVEVVVVVSVVGRLLVLVGGTGVVQFRPVNSGTQSTLKLTLNITLPPILVGVEPVVADDPGLPPIRLKR